MRPSDKIAQLRGPILRSVSRSFYLSIRLLPGAVRDQIALAYLLARMSDTIADTITIDREMRLAELRKLARRYQGEIEATDTLTWQDQFAPLQQDPSERVLLQALPDCLNWLDEQTPEDLQDIRVVLGHITRGQLLDLERFDEKQVGALQNAAELDEYTYLVAGSVGEFWTDLCSRKIDRFAGKGREAMRELGRRYGQGLQLINVLRDAGTDLRADRCYLPREELSEVGVAPEDVLQKTEVVGPVLNLWLDKAADGVAAGVEYSCQLRSFRLRFATALPALIGARTIALLRAAGSQALEQKVKVNRAEVRQLVGTTAIRLASPAYIRQTFARLIR